MKGRTKWFRTTHTYPSRPGMYECGVRASSLQRRLWRWMLEYDGEGFLVPFPMRIYIWRGLTKKAYDEAIRAAIGEESNG